MFKATVVSVELKKPAGEWEKVSGQSNSKVRLDTDTGPPVGLGLDTMLASTMHAILYGLLDVFAGYHYPAEIGPGVYDIHSPRVPAVDEMAKLLKAAAQRLPADQLWVNPDCGLKTRKWPETRLAVENMVAAAQSVRAYA